ncbi:ATP-binding cassette domain-containing protein [Methanolobus bombayensis]|uniref:ATP-binding cassette domain-containing protein n=1 Tax=Methanolobus bombayensis TaxID=38023 RepID=UPI001AE38ECC|nr:ATP-binding cassette domain-containing protein [Methanolobus bombayensis]MBP1908687.1 ABC-2 type transport system ATP-binding protein [Methanolobus bombayensis]
MYAIEVENLVRKFGDFTAVNDLTFRIKKGEVFGLLGPNGAGKTTTISMLSTMLPSTSGKAFVNGFDISKDQDNVRKSIGIVFQDQSLDEELTAYENMDFHGRLYRIPKSTRQKKIAHLLKLVELYDKKDNQVKTYSGGMRRRLEIARGLLHEPQILFLDEPTLGLDPQTRNHLWDYIEKLNKEKGITIILTTHYMEEADKLCHRIAIIDKGKIIAMDSSENLKNDIGGDVITIDSSQRDVFYSALKTLPEIKSVELHDSLITISIQNAEQHVARIVNIASENNIGIKSLSIHKPTLEDVFLHFTGRTIREEEASAKDKMRMMRKVRRR